MRLQAKMQFQLEVYSFFPIRLARYCKKLHISVMKFQARNLPDRIFCGTYAEVSNLRHAVP
jgi:hypothetical protein